jgi:hypothetical protein
MSRAWVFPRAYASDALPGTVVVPANPAITFAREMPVSQIGTFRHKYIAFQWVAAGAWCWTINSQESRATQSHMA